MLEILFLNAKTGEVVFGVTDVSRVRYITPSEICYDRDGRTISGSFPAAERVEISHKTDSPMRAALMREVTRG